MAQTNNFLRFQALGYDSLVPIVPPGAPISENSSLNRQLGKGSDPRGKTVGVKGYHGKWYGFDWVPYQHDEQDLARWHSMGAGVGVKTGDGLVMIDADTTNKEWAQIIRDEVAKLIPLTSVRVGQYPKAGYVIRTDPDFQYRRIEFGSRNAKGDLTERVEILSTGRQFVAHGIHQKTGKPYEWPKGIPARADLPFVSTADLVALLERLSALLPAASPVIKEGGTSNASQASLRGELEPVRAAVRAIPNTSALFPSRESYRNFLYAIKASLPDNQQEALDLAIEWSERWTDGTNDLDTVMSDWRRMKPPFRRGASWLYELAEKYSGGSFTIAHAHFDDLGDEEQNPFAQQIELNALKEKSDKFKPLRFFEAAASALDEMSSPLIKGLLDQGAMSVLYGDSNVGKTFVAMDMAYHIAAGLPYAGMKTQQMAVLYVAMEGQRGASRRVQALREKFKPTEEPPFSLLKSAVDLRHPEIDLNAFIAMLKAEDMRPHKIGLIVVDTLARAMAGGDENSPVDMGAVVTNVGAVQAAIDAHIMIVHHTGKDKAKGARGHSSLRAATDTELEVSEGLIAVTKQRDLDKSWTSAFSLNVHRLGLDREGDPVTSCTVRLDVATAARKREATEGELAVLDAIETLADTSDKPEKGARMKDLEAWCKDNLSGMSRDTLNQHIRGLRSKSLISQKVRGFWISERKTNSEDLLPDCEESIFA